MSAPYAYSAASFLFREGINVNVFACSYQAVEHMREGKDPTEAAQLSLLRIAKHYPHFSGALVAVNKSGHYGEHPGLREGLRGPTRREG